MMDREKMHFMAEEECFSTTVGCDDTYCPSGLKSGEVLFTSSLSNQNFIPTTAGFHRKHFNDIHFKGIL